MTIEFQDQPGIIRKVEDIEEARRVVEESMLLHVTKIPPSLFVQLPIIRDSLRVLAKVIRRHEELKAQKESK